MVLQNYQHFIEMTSNMIYTVALGVGMKCPRKIHLNTQWGRGSKIADFEMTWFMDFLRNYFTLLYQIANHRCVRVVEQRIGHTAHTTPI